MRMMAGLTTPEEYDMISPQSKQTYIFRASWASTGTTLKVQASDEDEAWEKVSKERSIKGCLKIELVAVR